MLSVLILAISILDSNASEFTFYNKSESGLKLIIDGILAS